jgi:nicotinate-nucleotide adenylyltransferase
VASEALWRLALDEVRLVPARLPPHKPEGARGTAEQRLRWTRALAEGRRGIVVADDELRREGPSYTADTMEALARSEPDAELWFLLGSDQLEGLPGWRDPARLLAVARLGVVPREGHSAKDVDEVAAAVAPGRVDRIDAPRVDVSSTDLRDRLAGGAPVAHLVPPAVLRELAADGLVASAQDA